MLRPSEEIARGLGLSARAAGELDPMVSGAGVPPPVDEEGVCSSYALGRDLQFIRINGTLVGGLVGVLIHLATEVM